MCLQQRGEIMKKVATKKKTMTQPKKATKIKGLEEYNDEELDFDEDYEDLDLEDEDDEEVEEKPKKKKKSTRKSRKKKEEAQNEFIRKKM